MENSDTLKKREELAELLEKRFGSKVPEFYRVYLKAPYLLEKFLGFRDSVMKQGKLPSILKEKIAFLTSTINSCLACSKAHEKHLVELGCSVDEIKMIENLDFEGRNRREHITLKATFEAVQNKRIQDSTLRELKDLFNEDEVLEIISVISLYMFLNTFNNALGLK